MGPAFPSPLKIFHIWLTITLLNRIPVNILTDCNVHKNSFSNILVFQVFFDLFSFFTSNAQFHCHVFSIGAVHFISGIPLFFGSYIPHWTSVFNILCWFLFLNWPLSVGCPRTWSSDFFFSLPMLLLPCLVSFQWFPIIPTVKSRILNRRSEGSA